MNFLPGPWVDLVDLSHECQLNQIMAPLTPTQELTRSHYAQLQERVSTFFANVIASHSSRMKCGRGCYTCCASGLSMSAIEADTVVDFLKQNQDRLSTILELQRQNPHQGEHCVFLNAEGHCQIYEVRPLICRSHGAPVQYKSPSADTTFRDVCPLNFEDLDIDLLPVSDVLNMETVNTLLALLNSQYAPERRQDRIAMKDLISLAQK